VGATDPDKVMDELHKTKIDDMFIGEIGLNARIVFVETYG
jgi:hypothetical protein